MQSMYPVSNSRTTQLTGDISAAAQVIPVADSSVFPAAPNYATIGTENNAETVLYTGLEEGRLTGVQRGVSETVATSWQIGAEVYHCIAADNLNAMMGQISECAVNLALTAGRITNPNILHNWDFRNPINQRGKSSYASGYTIDRWRTFHTGTVEVVPGGVRLTADKTGYFQFVQHIENPKSYHGGTYTATVETAEASYTITATVQANGTEWISPVTQMGDTGFNLSLYSKEDLLLFRIMHNPAYAGTGTITLRRVKLEAGTASTLAADPPMDYGVELAKCQRFYQGPIAGRFSGNASNTSGWFFVPLPVTMRINPAIIPITLGAVYTSTAGGAISALPSNATRQINGVDLLNISIASSVSSSSVNAVMVNSSFALSADL